MEIQTTNLKRCDLIELQGRFDSSASAELEKALRASIDAGVYRLVLDMSGVEYLSSAAIRALVMAYKACRRWNRGDVRLAAVPARIQHVLELAGIWSLIQTYDTSALAVGSF